MGTIEESNIDEPEAADPAAHDDTEDDIATAHMMTAWISRPPTSLKYTLELKVWATQIALSWRTGSCCQVC